MTQRRQHSRRRGDHAAQDAPRRARCVRARPATGLIRGRTRECRISSNVVQRVEQWLSERRQLWESRFDRLGILLENDSPVDSWSPHSETNGDKS
ncbi:hypothetical protein CN212_24375 [Sinorhizobium meliloti]|nr:hypothetical protein CN238_12520 [Sinorhizobium meliloti]RVG70756.1 hypothetical protein CN220_14545 [Sinorhizobium meliloti]RVH33992.1 hypothetical protein CN214_06480 [Sinorhizobium meliloti]RVH38084.1 hypothetical protein CN211_05640 [Sinorhizobium meliloti]RVH44655.1 hypothetical protein CN212_24375 [Sinorhizobium meliloti]